MQPEPNLMPEHLLKERSRRRRVRQWQQVLLLEVLAIGGAVVALRLQVHDPTADSRQAIAGTIGQIDVVSSATNEAELELQGIQRQLTVATEVVRKPDWAILLSALALEGQGKVVFDSMHLSEVGAAQATGEGSYLLSLIGHCTGQNELIEFVQSLEGTGLFARVKITQTQSLPNPENERLPRLSFTIEARIQEAK